MGFAALHHPLQHRSFAEVIELFEAALEFTEALRVSLQGAALLPAPDSTPGSTST